MPPAIVKADDDGVHIVLDEPFALPLNAPLAVTVLTPSPEGHGGEREEWATLSAQSLARAYGEDEPEYAVDDLKS